MPFDITSRLRVRLATLFALGMAVAGCQSSTVHRTCTPGVQECSLDPGGVRWVSSAPPAQSQERLVPVSASEPADGPPAVSTAAIPAHLQPTAQLQPPAFANRPMPAQTASAPVYQTQRSNVTFFPTPQGKRSLADAIFRRPSNSEPPRLAAHLPQPAYAQQGVAPLLPAPAGQCVGPGCASAMMLRPVPGGTTQVDNGFVPAQRIAAEASPDSQPASFVPANRPPDSPGGVPILENSTPNSAGPPPKADPPKLDPPRTEQLGMPKRADADNKDGKAGQSQTLPRPRQVKSPQGYPELPTPTVTHPPTAPREFCKRALSDYIVEPPDVLQIELFTGRGDRNFPVRGTHLVRPDGTVGLGPYGSVFVAGLTLDQVKFKVADQITKTLADKGKYYEVFNRTFESLKVDVVAYNSKFFYIIADGGGYGEQVFRVLCTGNETILDAIAQVEGLPRVASKSKIWIARATPADAHHPNILPVDWTAITQLGMSSTNYQIYPGDRIFVNSDVRIRIDSHLAKIISPIERLFGITLLGSTTVNSIKGQQGQ